MNWNAQVITGKTGTSNEHQTITPEEGFSYVEYSVSDNGKVNANGTSVIKLYFSRKTAYYKVNDMYSDTPSSGLVEAAGTSHYRNSNKPYSCLYGQSITVHPIFTESNPERGYTVNESAITKTVTSLTTSAPVIFTFEYSKKVFTVKFDLNNVGTYSDSTIKGNIYSTTCKYGNTLNLPTITAFPYISTSSWYLNGNKVNDTDDTITIVEDSNVIRAFELRKYNLVRESGDGNWSYDGAQVTANNTDPVTYNDFPYYLKPATKAGYVFSHWLYRTNKNSQYSILGGNTLSGNILGSGVTSISYKPEFVAEEPKITSVSVNVANSRNNALGLDIQTNSITSHIYFKATKENGNPVAGLGKPIAKTQSNTYQITSDTVPNLAENSEILITPVYVSNNVITNTGKPWYGIIEKDNSNKLTLAAYPVYGVIGNDKDTTYENATASKDGLMSSSDKTKLNGIKNGANKTVASVTDISKNFASPSNSPTTFDSSDDAVVCKKAYTIGSITPDATNLDSKVDFKFIDTTYGRASDSKYGLVKLGSSTQLSGITNASNSPDTSKIYPVQATAEGNLGVYVPWTDDQSLPKTLLAVAKDGNSNSHTAVDSGPVYINTYDVKDGVPTPTHNNAISIEGADGISVTANNNGQIKISGHEKPAVLGTNSDNGYLVPVPSSTISTDGYFLTAKGNWAKPADTQVTFEGKPKNLNPTIITSDTRISNGQTNKNVVTSLVAGTGITLEQNINTGVLTINGPASSRTIEAGIGITANDSNNSKRILNLKTATADELGGVKVGAFGTGEISQGTITVDGNSCTIYAPPANGKYYPVEVNTDAGIGGHAVVKIPDVPSPFYDDTADENKFSIQLEDYKAISFYTLTAAFTGESVYTNPEIQAFLNKINPQMDTDDKIDSADKFNAALTNGTFKVTEKKGLSIICPSNVLTAQLDCYMETNEMTVLVPIKSTKKSGKQTISIMSSCPGAGFSPETTYNAYLRFTTKSKKDANNTVVEKGHTYNATIRIVYNSAEDEYIPDIII